MSELLLDIKDLWVEYRSDGEVVHAVNGVNLTLNKKETLGIVGETGAGKTTTALSILRLLPERTGHITKGSIIFDNTDLLRYTNVDMQAVRGERIAMIFQDPMTSLNPVLPVGRQIFEALELHNSSGKTRAEMDARVDAMLELVGIPARRKKEYPHQFSGGMKQRVVIAIALACDPELLIADEPTTALDVTIQAQVLAMMAELKERLGTSMIMITHDLGVVAETCDRAAIMYAGEIIESGTAEDIFESPMRHPYTDGLFDSIPDLDVDESRLRPINGLMPDPTALPEGCKFHPRCTRCMDICKTQNPETCSLTETHSIRCHLFGSRKDVTL